MNPDSPNAQEHVADAPATAPAEVMRTFTQEQVNAFVSQRLAEDRQRRPAPSSSKPVPAPVALDFQAQIEELQLRNAFDKRAAKLDLHDAAQERLFKLFKAERPEDPTAWFSETVDQFGLKSTNFNPSAPVTPGVSTPQLAPASAPNAPAKTDPVSSGALVNPQTLTLEKIAQLGTAGIREHHERALMESQQMAGAPPRPLIASRK